MKNLANCNPVEFISQGYKVIAAAKELFETTKVLEIRKNQPDYADDDTPEVRREKRTAQSKKNINEMLAVLMRDNPEKTAEVLGLMCFIEPGELCEHRGMEFLGAAIEILNSREVLDFLSSLTSQT